MTTETFDLDSIMAKVQKMLNVEGRTPEEAALYIEKAHAILAQYDLSIESITDLKADPRTAVQQHDAGTTIVGGKPDSWKGDVLTAIAQAFDCRILWRYDYEETKTGRLRTKKVAELVGFGHDVEAAGYAQSFVVNEIIRLSKEYSRIGWNEIKALAAERGMSIHDAESLYVGFGHPHPLKSEVYFVRGAAQTISESLVREARIRKNEAVADNPNALVIQKGDEINDFIGRKQYGDRWEAIKIARAETNAEYERASKERARLRKEHMDDQHDEARNAECPLCQIEQREAKETDAQRRKREEREARENARYSRSYYARIEREARATDHAALSAGQAAGRTIKIRPGVKPGEGSGSLG